MSLLFTLTRSPLQPSSLPHLLPTSNRSEPILDTDRLRSRPPDLITYLPRAPSLREYLGNERRGRYQ